VALLSRLPWLLFALQAGALADRVDRRRLMATVNVVRTVLLGVLGATILLDVADIWVLYVVAFGLGTAEVLFDTSAQAFLPRVVERSQLERANGLQMGAEIVGNQFIGPPLGGLLFSVTAALPILLDAGTFLVAAGLLALITASAGRAAVRPGEARLGDSAPGADPEAVVADSPRRRVRDDVREGLEWLRGNVLLRSLAVLLGLMNGGFMMFGAVFALFALQVLGLNGLGFGLLLTSMASGSVLASVTANRIVDRFGRGRTLWATLIAAIVLPSVQGATSSVWVVAGASVVFGAAAVLWNVITVSLRQAVIPDHLLGRVNAVYRFLGWGSMPVGAFIGGELASEFGLRAPFFAASAIMIIGVLALGRHIRSDAITAARDAVGAA
jgi:MFS family permease